MRLINKLSLGAILVTLFTCIANGQESKKYAKDGVAFEYSSDWQLTEKPGKDSNEIALSNAEADSQIRIIVIRKKMDSKEPMADAKKQVIDPWITSLINQYTNIAGIKIDHADIKTEAGGIAADGVKLTFVLDGQQGTAEACWVVLDKRLLLLYTVRPDKTAKTAVAGWDIVRQTIRVGAGEK